MSKLIRNKTAKKVLVFLFLNLPISFGEWIYSIYDSQTPLLNWLLMNSSLCINRRRHAIFLNASFCEIFLPSYDLSECVYANCLSFKIFQAIDCLLVMYGPWFQSLAESVPIMQGYMMTVYTEPYISSWTYGVNNRRWTIKPISLSLHALKSDHSVFCE